MRIAIIGTGISGLTAAYLLNKDHEITVYEKESVIGGHTATKEVTVASGTYAVDTGFIVFNDRTYPNFQRLMDNLGVAYKETEMSFSVHCEKTGLEYNGSNFNGLFAQRTNLLTPSFWWMLKDIVRFNRECQEDLARGRVDAEATLGDYLKRNNYGERFVQHYLLPMGAAIWSSSRLAMQDFPLLFFIRFFKNHGLLDLINRPQWYVIEGGSRQYLPSLTRSFADRIVCDAAVTGVSRENGKVQVHRNGMVEEFDQVVFACHSDQALELLRDPTIKERSVLSAIQYRENDVVLHTDQHQLPENQRAWASWNYRVKGKRNDQPVLTYNMNILQSIEAAETFCVTLNDCESIDEDHILGRYVYSHPVFTRESVAAATQWETINGSGTWFCGAYWGNGFHEDGCRSAFRVAAAMGIDW